MLLLGLTVAKLILCLWLESILGHVMIAVPLRKKESLPIGAQKDQ